MAASRGRQASALLANIGQHRPGAALASLNAALASAAKAALWERALHALTEMRCRRPSPDVVSYTALIRAAGNAGLWDRALASLRLARLERIAMDSTSYNVALAACQRAGRWQEALCLLTEMNAYCLATDAYSTSAVVGAAARGRSWLMAIELLLAVPTQDGPPVSGGHWSLPALGAALQGCQTSHSWTWALELLAAARRQHASLRPDVLAYNLALGACEAALAWAQALALLQDLAPVLQNVSSQEKLGKEGHSLTGTSSADIVTLNSVLSACRGSAEWQLALELFQRSVASLPVGCMPRPDAVSFQVGIAACSDAALWQEALSLLFRMPSVRLPLTLESHAAAIGALGWAGLWQRAIDLLEQSRGIASLTTGAGGRCFNAAISACERVMQWQEAVALLFQMRASRVHFTAAQGGSATYYPVIAAACQAGKLHVGAMLYSHGLQDGEIWRSPKNVPGQVLDLHSLSADVARAAVVHELLRFVAADSTSPVSSEEVRELVVIIGRGRGSSPETGIRVGPAVLNLLLNELSPPLVVRPVPGNPGRLRVPHASIVHWASCQGPV
eukprot:TRINITY_DN107427_c0_g1_i1.p1 TRINITY_DN107427_c0_g1~~TRINITY_DN107427_c0_g1_i1.p1  ORF type:complete len:561 (-),score=91.93 TRINITY_DN107427_c0_g1_i1:197-1879(-)